MQPIMDLGHSRQGQTKMGGVKWVSNPHVKKNDNVVYLPEVECSYPPKEGPSLPVEGQLHTLQGRNQNQQPEYEGMLFQNKGGKLDNPSKIYWAITIDSLGISLL